MEKLAGYCLSAVLLAAGFISVFAQEEVKYVKNGGTLTVKPSSVSGKITSITWKHKGNFVAEWMEDVVDLTYYGQFEGRTTMDITTGSLEIRNMGPDDSGVFVVEINNNVQSKTYNVTLIQPVPKPHVSIQPPECKAESESCTLVCEGNTEGAEPVTYSWNLGGVKWKKEGKDQTIDKTTYSVKMFSCRMKNPISEETSEPKHNPFYYNSIIKIVVGVLGGFGLGAAVGGVLYWIYHNKQRGNAVVSSINERPLADDANPDKPAEVKELMTDTNSGAAEKPATESG